MSKVISQSEVDEFLNCKRRHFYAHVEKLQPKQYSMPLKRGTIGHDALARYYLSLKELKSFDQAKDDAIDQLNSHASVENMEVLLELTIILNRFFDWAAATQGHWEILEVEREYRVPVPNSDLTFPFKVDLLIRNTNNDKIYLVDHKFILDFYNSDLLGILPQMAKYIGGLRILGIDVHDGIYQMFRTRKMKSEKIEDRLRIEYLGIKDVKIKRYLQEQFTAMKQITASAKYSQEVYKENFALRSANQFNCRSCPFLDLCTIDLIGGDRDLLVKSFYEPNEYGYK